MEGFSLISERRERTPEVEEGDVQNDLFAISTFDGGTVYEEIIKAADDFYLMYGIRKEGMEAFTKQSCHQVI